MRSKEVDDAKDRLFELKQSMELSDLISGCPICEDVKLNIKAINTVLNYISDLEKEIIILENTKNTCPVTNTSGLRCDLKKYMKPFYHIERKKDVDG